MPNEMSMPTEMMSPNGRAGNLYMQTNEVNNVIVHYHRSASGAVTEVERAATGGAGSGEYKPISNQDSAPNAFEGAGQRHPLGRFGVSYLRPMAATIQSPACCAGSSEPVGVEKHAVSG